jgi:hypothetical protein
MRITKKYTGNSSIGKRTFTPLMRTPENAPLLDNAQNELKELRRTWLSRLLLAEQWNNRKMSLMKASIAKENGGSVEGLGVFGEVPVLHGTNLNQAMNHFFGSEQADRQQQIREDHVLKALKPYVKDPSDTSTFLNWVKSSYEVLNASHPSLSDLNRLIEVGDNSIPELYKKLLQSAVLPITSVTSTVRTSSSPLVGLGKRESVEDSRHTEGLVRVEDATNISLDQIHTEGEIAEIATTVSDDSISSHEDEIKSPQSPGSVSPVLTIPMVSTSNRKSSSSSSNSNRKRKLAAQHSQENNTNTVNPKKMDTADMTANVNVNSATNIPMVPSAQSSTMQFNYAATAAGAFGLPGHYLSGYPPNYLSHQPVPSPLSFYAPPPVPNSNNPVSSGVPVPSPPPLGLPLPSYAEYIAALNNFHMVHQQHVLFPPVEFGRPSPTTQISELEFLSRYYPYPQEMYRSTTFPTQLPSYNNMEMAQKPHPEQVPVNQERPIKKTKNVKRTASPNSSIPQLNNENMNTKNNIEMGEDAVDTNNSSIVSAAEALLGLFHQ